MGALDVVTTAIDGVRDREGGGNAPLPERRPRAPRPAAAPAEAGETAGAPEPLHEPGVGERLDVVA